ncbi:MAG TPA: hypothetical protein DGA22_06235 [Acidobacterium sp.]|nr:hypothetical protein [Acidobacterium sp.]
MVCGLDEALAPFELTASSTAAFLLASGGVFQCLTTETQISSSFLLLQLFFSVVTRSVPSFASTAYLSLSALFRTAATR